MTKEDYVKISNIKREKGVFGNDKLTEYLKDLDEVKALLSDVIGGKESLTSACVSRNLRYLKVRDALYAVDKIHEGKPYSIKDAYRYYDGKAIDRNMLTPAELFYAEVFQEWDEDLLLIMPEDAMETINHVLDGKDEVHALTNREGTIVRMVIWDGSTFDEIGKVMHVTRERVRQIYTKAIRKLRHPLRKKLLMDGLYETNRKQDFRRSLMEELNDDLAERETEAIRKAEEEKYLFNRDIKLEFMDLSVRSYNILRRANLLTSGAIADAYDTLPSLRNMGRKSLEEISNKLKDIGFEVV